MVGEAQTSNPNPHDPHNSSLQTRRRSGVVIPENFPVGTEVEVRTDEEGFKFVYFTAKVISPPALTKSQSQSPTKKVGRKKSAKKSDKETSICLEVEYHNLLASNKGRDRLRETLDISSVRPVPPVQEIDKCFEPGDVVDAYYKDGWWQGVVAEVVEGGGKFVVSFHDPPDLHCALKNLRYHWDWVDGSWVRPYKENMSGLMFQVGREVEVSFDREESQDAWFPASIHEDLGNGFFRVEYMNKNGEAVKTTVDSLHVRPCPPLLKDKNFVLLEKVDAYFDYCWWSGVITKELENSRYIVFFKPMKQDREIYQSKLRPHMEWKEGKWFTSSQEASLQSLDDGVHEHHISENASATVAAAPVKNSVNGKDTCDEKTLTSLTSTKDQVEQLTPDNQKMSHTNTSLKKRRRYLTDSGAIQSLPPKKPKEGNVAVTKPQDKTGEEHIKEVLCGFVSPDSASNTDTSAMQTTEDHPAFDHSWEKKIQRKQRNVCSKQNSSGMITPTPCSMKNNKTIFKSQTLDIRGEVLGAAENYLEDVQNEHANEELEVPIIIGLPCFEAGSPGISGGRKSQGFKIKEVATIVNDQEPPLINSSILKDNRQPGTRESSERRKRGWPKRTPVESTQTPVSGKSQNGNVATFDLNKKNDSERSHEMEVIEMESMLSNQKTEVNKEKVADGLPYPKNKRVRTKKRTSPSVHKEKGMKESVELGENLLLKKKGRKMTAVQVLGMQWAKSIIVTLSDDEEEVIQNLQLPSTNTTSSGQLEIQLQDPALGSEHLPSGDNTLSSVILSSFHPPQIQEPSIPPLDKGKKIIASEPEKAKPPSDKGKRSTTSKSKRVGKKSKKSSEHPSKERAKKDMVWTAANDIFTIKLPKGLAELDQYGCVDFLHHLHTADDNFVYSSHTPEQVERAMAQKLCQFLTLLSRTSKHSGPLVARELRDLLKKRDQEILQVTTDLTNATAEIEALKKQLAEEKVASERVHSELENHFKTKAEELKKSFKAKEQELETRGFLQGLELCRKCIFRTVPGQSFLKDLHEGLISAYLKSTLFLSDLSPHIGHFVSHGFKSAVRQVQAKGVSRELTSSLDPMAAVETLKASPSFEGDENLPLDHPWWLPVMKRAVDKLAGSTFSDPQLPASDQVLYDLDSSEGTSSQEVSLLQDQVLSDLILLGPFEVL